MLTTFFRPRRACQSAITTTGCAWAKLVRTMKGERSVTTEVAAAITIMGILAWVASGAAASASGVRPKPASALTFSLTISSCTRRRVWSATAPSSLMISSIRLPATVAPFCWR